MAPRPVQAAFGALCFAALGCSPAPSVKDDSAPKRRAPSYDLAQPAAELVAPAPRDGDFARGVSLALSASEDDDARKPAYLKLLDEMASIGASDLELVVEWSQLDAHAIEITPNSERTVDDDLLRWLMDQAKDRKLRVFLSPVLDVEQTPHVGVSPEPQDWNRWWWSYQRFVQHYARIADVHGAAMLSIGHELDTTEGEAERWREVVKGVRKVFDGPLTYVSRAERVEKVAFWDAVDVIAVSARAEVPTKATDAEREAGLRATFQKVSATAHKLGRGFVIADGAEAARRERGLSPASSDEQLAELRHNRALFRVLSSDKSLRGIYGAGWLLPGRVLGVATAPKLEPSARVLGHWFSAPRAATQGRLEPTSQVAR